MTDPRITYIRAQLTVWGLWRRGAGPETAEARRIDDIVECLLDGPLADLLRLAYVDGRPMKAKYTGASHAAFVARRSLAEEALMRRMETPVVMPPS